MFLSAKWVVEAIIKPTRAVQPNNPYVYFDHAYVVFGLSYWAL